MLRISTLFLLFLLSFPLCSFSQEAPKYVLLSEALGRLQATEFIELTSVDLEHINTGFRHCLNNKLPTLYLIDTWEPAPQQAAVIALFKLKIQELSALVKVRNDATSAEFIQRLLEMNRLADEIFSIVSRMEFPNEEEALRLKTSAAHISNLLNFSLRVFQKQRVFFNSKTLENVEALVELAKGETIYTHVNHQGEVLPSEVVPHLDLFMPREEFMARMTLFALIADFVSDPNNQFRKPKMSIQDGKLMMDFSYCLTLFGNAKGDEPWERGGPGLVTYLFKLFYERQLGAKVSTVQDFENKMLQIKVEVPLTEPMERHASLAGALSRLEASMYLRQPGSLAENYIFLDSAAHEISDRLSQVRGELSPEVLRRTVTDVLERQVRDPKRAIDMDLLVEHLSRWGREEKSPWSLDNVSFIARHLQKSVLKEAKRAAK